MERVVRHLFLSFANIDLDLHLSNRHLHEKNPSKNALNNLQNPH